MASPTTDPRLLVVTGGHPFDRNSFCDAFDAIAPNRWTHVEQPLAQTCVNVDACTEFDTVVFYDMPGIRFTKSDPPTEMTPPPQQFVDGLLGLMDAGKGLVFLHHAVASWPSWPLYADIVGARFHYQPAILRNTVYPDSGYRFDVRHTVEVLDRQHPICAGLGESFELTDELYLYPVLNDSVEPLLRTTFPMDDASLFYSADYAIRGRRNTNDGWSHPVGSDLVGWVKHAHNSPVAYLQFGDGPQTYADLSFRRVVANAVAWAASPQARTWARARAAASPL